MCRGQLAAVAVIGLAGAVGAQDTEIESVTESQIEAFQADNFVRAFEFVHPPIRNNFGTPENFGRMVIRGYPMVVRPAQVTVLDLCEIEGDLWQGDRSVDRAGG